MRHPLKLRELAANITTLHRPIAPASACRIVKVSSEVTRFSPLMSAAASVAASHEAEPTMPGWRIRGGGNPAVQGAVLVSCPTHMIRRFTCAGVRVRSAGLQTMTGNASHDRLAVRCSVASGLRDAVRMATQSSRRMNWRVRVASCC